MTCCLTTRLSTQWLYWWTSVWGQQVSAWFSPSFDLLGVLWLWLIHSLILSLKERRNVQKTLTKFSKSWVISWGMKIWMWGFYLSCYTCILSWCAAKQCVCSFFTRLFHMWMARYTAFLPYLKSAKRLKLWWVCMTTGIIGGICFSMVTFMFFDFLDPAIDFSV